MPRGDHLLKLNTQKQKKRQRLTYQLLNRADHGDTEAQAELKKMRAVAERNKDRRPALRIMLNTMRSFQMRSVLPFSRPVVCGRVADEETQFLLRQVPKKWRRGQTVSGHPTPQFRHTLPGALPPATIKALEAVVGCKLKLIEQSLLRVDKNCRGSWLHSDAAEVDQKTRRLSPDATADSPLRHLTIIVLLAHEGLVGGEIAFPHARRTFNYAKLQLGSVLVWANVDAHGRPTDASIHNVLPVKQGVKLLFQAWARVD